MIQQEANDAKLHLTELIDAAVRGEQVFIAADSKHGRQIVQLVAVVARPRTPQFGSARGMIHIADDFDAPLPDFAEYQ